MLISLYAQTVIYVRSITRSSADADNRRDAFSGQPRSPNIVPFHILGIVSHCAIVTWSFRRAPFTIFDLNKCRDLEIGVKGHSRSLKVVPCDRSSMVFRLDGLALSVIATATWLAGWLAGCHTPVLYQNG